jgi:NAD+ synthase (glutamine-hydrolysing)
MGMTLPQIALVQMDVKAGRPDLNVANMLTSIEKARAKGSEIIAFSEMCISGYILGDLWEVDAFVEDFVSYSEDIRAASDGLTVIFGNVALAPQQIGQDGRQRKYNAVYVCCDREYVVRPNVPQGLPCGIHPKTLHPNYRFFDDDRHFFSLRQLAEAKNNSPYDWTHPYAVPLKDGRIFRFGVQLCEDMWCQDYELAGETLDTLKVYKERGAEAVFNLSASPWTWQKNDKRNRVVQHILAAASLPFFYINQVGAQNNGKNIIVFDGDSTAYAPDGSVLQRSRTWNEDIVYYPSDEGESSSTGEMEAIYNGILTGLRHLDHIRGAQNRTLVAASGGIDSSVVACLLERAFGPERVFAVNMPTRFNAQITQDNARDLCAALHIDYLSCPIGELYDAVAAKIKKTNFASGPGDYTRLVDENIQARIRFADMLSGLAAKYGLLFTNNGNKTEIALGYATLYGDISGAVAPIADLYKVQVFALARFLNERIYGNEVIPDNIINGEIVPSAELSEAQDVTKGLGDPIKYGYHDALLRQIIEYRKCASDFFQWHLHGDFFSLLGWDEEECFYQYFPNPQSWVDDIEWVERQIRINFFKRIQAPPIIVLSKRAFGFDLRESQRPEYNPREHVRFKSKILSMKWP